ncbi:MAG: response regulator, partial [Spirochaetes bacterium]|nr:response regulator [Spirochaetota bacterium]
DVYKRQDEEMVARMLKSFFELRGMHATVVHRGDEALKMLSKENFDAAIIDMRLPDITGDDLILHATAVAPFVRYFIYTGSIDYRLSDKLRNIGMCESDVIHKPVRDMNDIYNAIVNRVRK